MTVSSPPLHKDHPKYLLNLVIESFTKKNLNYQSVLSLIYSLTFSSRNQKYHLCLNGSEISLHTHASWH